LKGDMILSVRIPDFVLKCVGFVCEVEHRDGGGVPSGDPHGTGFFVSVPCEHPEMMAKGACAVYFVTAKHIIDNLAKRKISLENRKIYFSVNKIGGGKTTIDRVIGDRWWYHPTDKTTDVAIAQVWPSHTADLISVGLIQLGTPDILSAMNIGIGDEVFSAGLFTPTDGAKSVIPIVRHGNIAMMPGEQIQTELGYADVFLVEARSLPGISGSPVFVRPTLDFKVQQKSGRTADVFGAGLGAIVLGLMQAHWDVRESEKNEVFFTHDREHGVNMGIAMVVPAIKILETINQEELLAMRRNEEKRATGNMVPGMDSVKPKHRELSQKTVTGFEIPVPRNEQVLGDMKKASRKITHGKTK
jgi:hypothetical protein